MAAKRREARVLAVTDASSCTSAAPDLSLVVARFGYVIAPAFAPRLNSDKPSLAVIAVAAVASILVGEKLYLLQPIWLAMPTPWEGTARGSI